MTKPVPPVSVKPITGTSSRPSLQLRTLPPFALTVVHADTISFGQPTYQVTVTGQTGALAALSDGGVLLGYGYTKRIRAGYDPVNGQLPQAAMLKLTVTTYNSMPTRQT